MAVTSVSGRVYTVKEVYTAVHRFQDVCRSSNAHQVSRLVLRKMRNGHIEDVIHLLMSLAYGKASYRIAI